MSNTPSLEFVIFSKSNEYLRRIDELYRYLHKSPDIIIDELSVQLINKSMGNERYLTSIKIEPDKVPLILLTSLEEISGGNFLLNGTRQVNLSIINTRAITTDESVREYNLLPILSIIFFKLDSFFAFGGHNLIVNSDMWLQRGLNGKIEPAIQYLSEFGVKEIRTFYFDNRLFNSIPKNSLSRWAIFSSKYNSHGYLVSCRSDPFDIREYSHSQQNNLERTVFINDILPQISKRLKDELYQF